MKVLRSFLNDFVDISDISYKDLADKMVFVGNEYESISKISDSTNLVVGKVVDCKKHPSSAKLNICKVDINDGKIYQILCGAPNVKAGQKVIVAKVGATLPRDIVIKKATLAGMESEGMICSLYELGFEPKFLKEEDIEGIHVLSDDAPVGEDAIKFLGYDDEVIDFELTANRGDLQSILGMAYEVGAIYGRKVKYPDTSYKETNDDINDTYKLDVKTDNCMMYLGKKVIDVKIKESPKFIQTRLIASGIRPINNVVDISNYVMLEYGQPLHFFDADLLGNKVEVRMAKDKEEVTTLDKQKRILKSSDIVIANDKVVALAGVMGGLDTEINDKTKNIFIESAIFSPSLIRLTSKDILRSEASMRYEKGIDPNRTLLALNRACHLLEKYADAKVLKGVLSYDNTNKEDKLIKVSLDNINTVLGMKLTFEEVDDIFNRLDFKCKFKDGVFEVLVPTRRLDVNIKEDLIEEVGRIYGYDNIKGVLPTVSIRQGSCSYRQSFIKSIRRVLNGLGLNQVITYSLLSEEKSKLFTNEFTPVTLLDPISEDRKVMRNSLLASLLDVFEYNYVRNMKSINIFEVGSVYRYLDGYKEEDMVSGLIYGDYIVNNWQGSTIKADFYVLKGIVEELLNYLGLNNRYSFKTDKLLVDLHPNKSVCVYVDNDLVGYMGCVHPNVLDKEVYVFELSVEKLLSKKVRNIKHKEVSKFPSVNKDIAFVIPKDMNVGEVIKYIKKVGGRYLINLDVFDIYEGDKIEAGKKSVAFALTFQNQNKTMSEDEINHLFNGIIEEVEKNLDAKLRTF